MKVSCQSCGAQYNLPDDKVRGRKAKVRCKKCSAQIIVDGTLLALDEDDEATRVMLAPSLSSSGEPVWTVNLSDEEQLDMTEAEVLAGWRDGRVTEDAYVWREGMEEWLPVLESSLATAINAIAAKSAPLNAAPAPNAALGSAPQAALGSSPGASLGSSPQAAPAAQASLGSSPRAGLGSSPRNGLGSSPLAAPTPALAASPTPPPAVASEPQVSRGSVPSPKPKAQRSDDTSKAFSFALGASSSNSSSAKKASRPPGNAAAGLFAGLSAPSAASNQGVASNPSAGASSGGSSAAANSSENSVMFSLDALKAAAVVEPKRSSVRATAVSDARVNEDILTLGGPSRFDANAVPLIDIEVPPPAPRYEAPAAAPLALPPQKKSSWGLIAMGVIAVAGMAGAYILGQKGSDETPVAQNDGTEVRGERQGADEAAPAEGETTAAAAAPSATAEVASAAPSNVAEPSPAPAAGGGGGAKAVGGGGGGGSAAKPAEKTDKPVEAAPKPAATPAPAPAAKPAGPAFNVGAAKGALSSAAANAAGCRAPAGPSGTGKVQVTFAPSGNVTSALITSGPFGGTPVGSCVARTFRAAKVPAFDGSPVTVSKSFTIN